MWTPGLSETLQAQQGNAPPGLRELAFLILPQPPYTEVRPRREEHQNPREQGSLEGILVPSLWHHSLRVPSPWSLYLCEVLSPTL